MQTSIFLNVQNSIYEIEKKKTATGVLGVCVI